LAWLLLFLRGLYRLSNKSALQKTARTLQSALGELVVVQETQIPDPDTNAEAASTRRWFSLKRFITKQIVWTLPSISITSR